MFSLKLGHCPISSSSKSPNLLKFNGANRHLILTTKQPLVDYPPLLDHTKSVRLRWTRRFKNDRVYRFLTGFRCVYRFSASLWVYLSSSWWTVCVYLRICYFKLFLFLKSICLFLKSFLKNVCPFFFSKTIIRFPFLQNSYLSPPLPSTWLIFTRPICPHFIEKPKFRGLF